MRRTSTASVEKLTRVLGKPTLVVESGGQWINPKTGEVEPKLHIYWRLKIPARGQEAFAKLREAREIAAHIADADHSNISIVHPIRWPGSWHTKNEPRLCRIIEENDVEIDLDVALQTLRKAQSALICT
jgi:hypothetical protein